MEETLLRSKWSLTSSQTITFSNFTHANSFSKMMSHPLTERKERTLDNPHTENDEDDSPRFQGGSVKQLRNKFASSTRLIKKSTTAGIRT